MSCWSSGACVNNPTRYDGTQRTNLNLVRSISHNIAAIGYNHISIDATTDYIEVDSGYVLGYKPIAGKLSTITVPAADSDVKTTDVTSNGLQQALPAMKRHLLRAVSSGGSGAYIPVKFTSSGIKDITVTVSNKRIVRKETNTTQITVIEGIDKAIINIPKYIEKGLSTPFQLLPHTGIIKKIHCLTSMRLFRYILYSYFKVSENCKCVYSRGYCKLMVYESIILIFLLVLSILNVSKIGI